MEEKGIYEKKGAKNFREKGKKDCRTVWDYVE